MSRSFKVAVSVATLVVSVGCSRRNSGAAAADSAAPRADSVTAAAVGKPDSSPAAGPKSTGSTVAKTKSGTTKAVPVATGRPHLTKLVPSSGSLASGQIITVEIAGERFTATGNATFFGTIKLGDLASADGRTIRFAVPQTFPSRGEVPPMAMQPGSYGVYVVNSNGTSDTLKFTIKNE